MDWLTRRAFLKQASALTAGLMVPDAFGAGGPEKADASHPHISFPSTPRDRISVASYPFRAYIESPTNKGRDRSLPGMDLTEFPAEVVKKFDVRNIEPHNRHFRSLEPAYLNSFRKALTRTGVKAVNIAVDGRDSFYDPDLSIRKQAIAHARQWGGRSRRDRLPQHPCAYSASIQLGAQCAAHSTEFARSDRVRRREKRCHKFRE